MKKILRKITVFLFMILFSLLLFSCKSKVKITLDYGYDNEKVVKELEKDQVFDKPVDPMREGYKFTSWQLDGKDYDFKIKVSSDITLVAIWEKEVTFDNEIKLANKIIKNDILCTTLYHDNEIQEGVSFVAISNKEKEELRELLKDLNPENQNRIREILKGKEIKKGLRDDYFVVFKPEKRFEAMIKDTNFKYEPGEVAFIPYNEMIKFRIDIPAEVNYDKVVFTKVIKKFNSDTKTTELEEVEELKERTNNHEYFYKAESDIVLVILDYRDIREFVFNYDKDYQNNKELYDNHIKIEKYNLKEDGTYKWEPYIPKSGDKIISNTNLRFTIVNLKEGEYPALYNNSKIIELDKENVGVLKVMGNIELLFKTAKPANIKADSTFLEKIKFINKDKISMTDEGFSIPEKNTVEFELETTKHFELDELKLIKEDGEEIKIEDLKEMPIDPLLKNTNRKYLVKYRASANHEIILKEKPIEHNVVFKSSAINDKAKDFGTNPENFIEKISVEISTIKDNDGNELKGCLANSGSEIVINFKPIAQNQVSKLIFNNREIKIVDNKASIIIEGPAVIEYQILDMYKITISDNDKDKLIFPVNNVEELIEEGTLIYFKLKDISPTGFLINGEDAGDRIEYNEISKEYHFKLVENMKLELVP